MSRCGGAWEALADRCWYGVYLMSVEETPRFGRGAISPGVPTHEKRGRPDGDPVKGKENPLDTGDADIRGEDRLRSQGG
ncbi:Uncharacterised protein [Corynebacterium urealyticum]|nr:Uncharacterised protein [Corynebacterium urealyticum]